MAVSIEKLNNLAPPKGMEFHGAKVGHVILQVNDLARATEFDRKILRFKAADVYAEEMVAGGDCRGRPADKRHGVKSLHQASTNPVPGQDGHNPR